VIARGLDTVKFFEGVSYNKMSLTRNEFSNALLNLNLKSATVNDINELFTLLDSSMTGTIEIKTLDYAIRQ
jgi:Ca2+-binding EF-hand superfamily protein